LPVLNEIGSQENNAFSMVFKENLKLTEFMSEEKRLVGVGLEFGCHTGLFLSQKH